MFPSLFRRVRSVHYQRERIETPDGDFLDLDWSRNGSSRLVILLHGLEGDSTRAYMLGMAKALNNAGWDAASLNFRGCSGECNRRLGFYHSGETEDLHTVISHVVEQHTYSDIALVGFSLGGNVILKYLGEQGKRTHPLIKKAVAFSVPCDLASSSEKISRAANSIYLKRFLRMLRKKIRMKMRIMSDAINDRDYRLIKTFKDFDNRYTAPIFGFKDAEDYWEKASCKPLLSRISIPTLLVNAADDPFLTRACYPYEEAGANPMLLLEIPQFGGHVGFVTFNGKGEYWSESRAVSFLSG